MRRVVACLGTGQVVQDVLLGPILVGVGTDGDADDLLGRDPSEVQDDTLLATWEAVDLARDDALALPCRVGWLQQATALNFRRQQPPVACRQRFVGQLVGQATEALQ